MRLIILVVLGLIMVPGNQQLLAPASEEARMYWVPFCDNGPCIYCSVEVSILGYWKGIVCLAGVPGKSIPATYGESTFVRAEMPTLCWWEVIHLGENPSYVECFWSHEQGCVCFCISPQEIKV
jgi:hypothetical protein